MEALIGALENNDAIDINKVKVSRREKSSRARKFKALFGAVVFSGATAIATAFGCGSEPVVVTPHNNIVQPLDGGVHIKKDVGHDQDANTTKDATQDQDGEITRDDETDGGKPPEDTGNGDDGPKPDDVGPVDTLDTDGGTDTSETKDGELADTENGDGSIGQDVIGQDIGPQDVGPDDIGITDIGPGDTGVLDAGGSPTVCSTDFKDLQGNIITITKEHFVASQAVDCSAVAQSDIDEVHVRYIPPITDNGDRQSAMRGIWTDIFGVTLNLQKATSVTQTLFSIVRDAYKGVPWVMSGPFNMSSKTYSFESLFFHCVAVTDAETAKCDQFAGRLIADTTVKAGGFTCSDQAPGKNLCAIAQSISTTEITGITVENRQLVFEKGLPIKKEKEGDLFLFNVSQSFTVTEQYMTEANGTYTISGFDIRR
jgi:hypothetical protein